MSYLKETHDRCIHAKGAAYVRARFPARASRPATACPALFYWHINKVANIPYVDASSAARRPMSMQPFDATD